MKKKYSLFVLILLISFFLNGCKKESFLSEFVVETKINNSLDSSLLYEEQFRPQFHFSPKEKWMNDPNGMFYYKGIYHLFYQYYPNDIVWGPMHWGHAVSKDLIHWEHKPIALYPDKLGYIFSGSVVVDQHNSSGLGSKENPPLVALFTYLDIEIEKKGQINTQSQGLAFSIDNGETWNKYHGNPIIANSTKKDFRDPKCFWNETTKQWNMVLVAGDRAEFYSSDNLIDWIKTGEFGEEYGAHGGVWECPDLLRFNVGGTEKWVLLISINPGAPLGGSGTQYFIGDFDGKTFTTNQKEAKWLDFGTDNYAGVTYSNVPNNDKIFIGWMGNWQYAQKTPTKKWRSAMTLPRKLVLEKFQNQYILKNQPYEIPKSSIESEFTKDNLNIEKNSPITIQYAHLNQSQITFNSKSKHLKVIFSNTKNEKLVIEFDEIKKSITIDRTNSGIIDFEENFGKKPHVIPMVNGWEENNQIELFVDQSSVEMFINDGRYSFTEIMFPTEPYTKLTFESESGGKIIDISINYFKSIWKK